MLVVPAMLGFLGLQQHPRTFSRWKWQVLEGGPLKQALVVIIGQGVRSGLPAAAIGFARMRQILASRCKSHFLKRLHAGVLRALFWVRSGLTGKTNPTRISGDHQGRANKPQIKIDQLVEFGFRSGCAVRRHEVVPHVLEDASRSGVGIGPGWDRHPDSGESCGQAVGRPLSAGPPVAALAKNPQSQRQAARTSPVHTRNPPSQFDGNGLPGE